ncbi:MAG: CHRD domain-containing protein [Methylobacter sp.]|nr:CHRD domain-containing protein [Methylobacter sp.]
MKSFIMYITLFLALVINSSVSAQITTYSAVLSGPGEEPPNNSLALGVALVTLDTGLNSMTVDTTFTGLTSNVTAAHIHCCTAVLGAGTAMVATQVPTFPGFPLGVKLGSYNQTFDMASTSSYNPAFLALYTGPSQAFNALAAGLNAGTAYFNIHTSNFPTGEIRGFRQSIPTAVPIPAAFWLMGSALATLMSFSRRRIDLSS